MCESWTIQAGASPGPGVNKMPKL